MVARKTLLMLALAAVPGAAEEAVTNPEITSADFLSHVRRLASDDWEGRGTGSEGERKATEYIAAHFKRLGFEPAGVDGTYFQPVKVPAGIELGKCSLETAGGAAPALALDKEFRPFSASASGRVEGELVFAGYGVSAPGMQYDDYAAIEVTGKIVVIFRNLPHAGEQWGKPAARRHATFVAKLSQAVRRGAIGLILVNDPWGFPTKEEAAKRKARARRDGLHRGGIGGPQGPRIPFVHVTRAAAAKVFPAWFGASPEELEAFIHDEGKPASRTGKARVTLATQVTPRFDVGRNVCALLRAKGQAAVDEIIVVGGHHDHLGRGNAGGSLERDPKKRKTIHNGADDNASGTAGVLEVASYMAARAPHVRRSVLFLTFTGEERGLVGSRHFVNNPTIPLEKIAAMINMDMIGRLEGKNLFVGGVGTSPRWRPLLKRVNETIALKITEGEGGRAPSDNTSFYNKGKPVLFFFTGLHPDYHRPSDDVEKVDGAGAELVARLAAGVTDELARGSEPIPFTKADRGGFGPPRPVLGISAGPAEGGVAVAGLAPDSAAAKAGMLRGDVIVELGGKPVKDLRGLRAAMRGRKIGDKVTVRVLRDGQPMTFEVVLGKG
ncbi:MAG: M28 family peptidase [Planctomycetota bacterium]|jgi:hypothetical protein